MSILLMMLLSISLVQAYPLELSDVVQAKQFLENNQASDGSIDSLGTSNWASVAVWSLNESSADWKNQGDSLEKYIESNVNNLDDTKATDWARSILSIVAMCRDPFMFGGIDHVAKLKSFYVDNQLGDTALLNDDTYGLMALCAAGECSSAEATYAKQFIIDNQNSDGGWSWGVGQASDPDSTAAAIMALETASADSAPIINGLAYLKSVQVESGGFDSGWGTNPNTDAMCIMAIDAAGQDPNGTEWQNPNTPLDSLLSFQDADGGFNSFNKAYATSQAIPALLGRPYSEVSCNFKHANVRIQGSSNQLFSGDLIVDDHITIIDEGSNPHELLIPSALGALDKASQLEGFPYNLQDGAWGLYVNSINGEEAIGSEGWMFFANHESPPVGMAEYEVSDGDELLFYFGTWGIQETRLSVNDSLVNAGNSFTATVEYYDNGWQALESATVHFGLITEETDENGEAILPATAAGSFEAYADKEGFINSNRIPVQVTGTAAPSQTLTLEAEVMPSVAFSVAPNNINFGQIGPRMTKQGSNIILTNTGTWDIVVTATLSDADSLFSSGLFLDNVLWSSLSKLITSDSSDFLQTEEINSELDVPSNYEGLGQKSGVVTFWAQGIQ